VKRCQKDRERAVHIEEDPDIRPEEYITRLGENILYFYQPDEDPGRKI
jgi:hypothetical protein